VTTLDDLRAQKRYEILTPEQCVERIRASGEGFAPCLHPLVGGMPLERAWQGLECYVERVVRVLDGD
jgi:hypothetical protein